MLFIDPDGKDITISYNCSKNDKGKEECYTFTFDGTNAEQGRELNNTFVNQFLDAYEYASANGGSEYLVEAATNSDLNIGLRQFNAERADKNPGSHFHPGREVLYWAPLGGSAKENGVVLSPATVLEHEMQHAVTQAKMGPMAYSRLSKQQREGASIAAENRAALANGEISPGQVTRYNHGDGHVVVTYDPASNQVNRQATYQYYRWLNQNTSFDVLNYMKRYRGK